jgi:hypothetical protein
MSLKIYFLGHFGDPTFPQDGWINNVIKNGDIITHNPYDANILIVGCFLTNQELGILLNSNAIKILNLTEPIEHFDFCKNTNFLFKNNFFDYVIGLISNNKEKGWIKNNNPFYRITNSKKYKFSEVNEYVKKIELSNKKFCVLINRHDPGNTRGPIYLQLKKLGNIDCPGILFNNCSNVELNKIGNIDFIRNYVFNICSENFTSDSYDGYISEKILNCCLGGSIPIYYGKLDDDDKKIYNENRVIFVNKDNVNYVYERVKELMNNSEKLVEFYKQDVFMSTAYEECERQNDNIIETFNEIRKKLKVEIDLYNEYHMGDCLITIILLNKIKEYLQKNNIIINFHITEMYIYQVKEFIQSENIRLYKYEYPKGMNTWVGSNEYKNNYIDYEKEIKSGIKKHSVYLIDFGNEFYEKLGFDIKIDDILYEDEDLLERYNKLPDKYKNLDYLILNNVPMSGQYNYVDSRNKWDNNIRKLAKKYKIATILNVDNITCTLEDRLTIKDIAAISINSKNIIAINSGPFIGCLNKHTFNNCKKILVYSENLLENIGSIHKNFKIVENLNWNKL